MSLPGFTGNVFLDGLLGVMTGGIYTAVAAGAQAIESTQTPTEQQMPTPVSQDLVSLGGGANVVVSPLTGEPTTFDMAAQNPAIPTEVALELPGSATVKALGTPYGFRMPRVGARVPFGMARWGYRRRPIISIFGR